MPDHLPGPVCHQQRADRAVGELQGGDCQAGGLYPAHPGREQQPDAVQRPAACRQGEGSQGEQEADGLHGEPEGGHREPAEALHESKVSENASESLTAVLSTSLS